jgi:hypothetical protein
MEGQTKERKGNSKSNISLKKLNLVTDKPDRPSERSTSFRQGMNLLVTSIVVWCILILITTSIRYTRKPSSCRSIDGVSGFYGPGAYGAWVLSMISAICGAYSEYSEGKAGPVSADLIAVSVGVLVAIVDLQLRLCYTCGVGLDDFQALAALHVLIIAPFFLAIISGLSMKRYWMVLFLVVIIQLLVGVPTALVGGSEKLFKWVVILLINMLCLGAPAIYFLFSSHALAFVLIYMGTYSGARLFPETLVPQTGSKISDMDQVVTLATAIVALAVQWKIWRLPSFFAGKIKQRWLEHRSL